MTASPIDFDRIKKRYGGVNAVDGVTLGIDAGEFVSLLGASGSGKTTTLMIAAGFVRPDEGDVLIAGARVTDLAPERRNLGVVFQSYALFPNMNVYENIAFPLRMRRQPPQTIKRRVEDILQTVELGALRDRKIGELSGGQQQRVALARALVYEPPVLLLDEPLSALDRKLRDQLQTELKRIQGEFGITVVYVTHDQEEALSMSDRIAVMADGVIEQVGSPDEVYEQPRSSFVAGFIGESNFFFGPVQVAGEDAVITADDGGDGMRLSGTAVSTGAAQKGHAMVRPESLVVGNQAKELPNQIVGEIEFRQHLGATYRFTLNTPLGRMILKGPRGGATRELSPGDSVLLGWPKEAMRIFEC